MCYAILKVGYRSSAEADQMIVVERPEDYEGKLEEVKGRPEVVKVTTFFPLTTYEIVPRWEARDHSDIAQARILAQAVANAPFEGVG